MAKFVISKVQQTLILLSTLLSLGILILGIASFTPADSLVYLLVQGIFLVVFYGTIVWYLTGLVHTKKISRKILLDKSATVVILTIGLGLAIYAGFPSSLSMTEAIAYNEEREQVPMAVTVGQKVAEIVQEKNLNLEQAWKEIQKEIPTDVRGQLVAGEVLLRSLQGLTVELVPEPTIPVRQGLWTCNSVGCSFATSGRVWTIGSADIWLSGVVKAVCLAGIIWTVYGTKRQS